MGKPLNSEDYCNQQIARAVRFFAWLHLGPGETHRRECKTQDEVLSAADEMDKLSHYGRRTLAYAVTPEGNSFPIKRPGL